MLDLSPVASICNLLESIAIPTQNAAADLLTKPDSGSNQKLKDGVTSYANAPLESVGQADSPLAAVSQL